MQELVLYPPLATDVALIAIVAVGLILSSALSLVTLSWIKNNSGKSRSHRQLEASGSRATGKIVQVTDTGTRINGDPRLRLEIAVQPSTGESFTTTHTQTVSLIEIPKPGQTVTVFYDPLDHSKIAIDLTPPAAASTENDSDPLEKLGRLADMHDQGLLTDEEFEERKRQLLPEI